MFRMIEQAHQRIGEMVTQTPVLTSSTLDEMTRAHCFLKCENFQKTGSFKFRGALNALSSLPLSQRRKGVITHSSGNHAQAVALAAKTLGVKAVVVMPRNASPTKVRATEGYGAEVIFCSSHPVDRERAVEPLVVRHGYTLIHPSNDLNVIAGAGTVGYELTREVDQLDYVFCPVGGGGLISGTAIATKGTSPSMKVIGVEPKNADDAYRSMKAGRIVKVSSPDTIADGLRTSLGSHTFRIMQENVDSVVTVSEEEIVDAMQFLWERMKLVVEPSGAVALAGVLSKQINLVSKRVGIIVSGGNIDLTDFFTRVRRSWLRKGRTAGSSSSSFGEPRSTSLREGKRQWQSSMPLDKRRLEQRQKGRRGLAAT